MQFIRSKLFSASLVIWMVIYILPIPFLVFGKNADSRARVCSKFYCKGFLFLCKYILNLTFEVRGEPGVESQSPVIYAVKHQSAWETVALFFLIPNIVPILKVSLTKIPIFGWYLRRLRMIAVDRAEGRKALLQMLKDSEVAIAEKRNLLIFPEGTRQPPLYNPELKSGVYLLYRRLGLRVVPVALNSGVLWPKDADIIRAGKVTVSFLTEIKPGLGKQEFLEKLHESLSIESNKLVEELTMDGDVMLE